MSDRLRNILRLDVNKSEHFYNLANILSKQNINRPESIDLYLQAARMGCESSFKMLLRLILVDDFLTSSQIAQYIQIRESTFPYFTTIITNDETDGIPFLPWLLNAHENKLSRRDFQFWQTMAAEERQTIVREKQKLFHESQVVIANCRASAETQIMSEEDSTDEDGVELVAETTNWPVKRALETLRELAQVPSRNLTFKDLLVVQKCFRIIMNETNEIQFSHKGKTSGSRVQVDGFNYHLPHSGDRMSPGAQHSIKTRIQETLSTVEQHLSPGM